MAQHGTTYYATRAAVRFTVLTALIAAAFILPHLAVAGAVWAFGL